MYKNCILCVATHPLHWRAQNKWVTMQERFLYGWTDAVLAAKVVLAAAARQRQPKQNEKANQSQR